MFCLGAEHFYCIFLRDGSGGRAARWLAKGSFGFGFKLTSRVDVRSECCGVAEALPSFPFICRRIMTLEGRLLFYHQPRCRMSSHCIAGREEPKLWQGMDIGGQLKNIGYEGVSTKTSCNTCVVVSTCTVSDSRVEDRADERR